MSPFTDSCGWILATGLLMLASFRVGKPWLSAVAAVAFFILWLPIGLDWSYWTTFAVMHVYAAAVLGVCMLLPQADL